MSLADELLADLDDIEDEVEGEEAGREEVMEAVAEMDTKGDRSVRSFAKLLDGEKVWQCPSGGGGMGLSHIIHGAWVELSAVIVASYCCV